jgi:hypothetical protein
MMKELGLEWRGKDERWAEEWGKRRGAGGGVACDWSDLVERAAMREVA